MLNHPILAIDYGDSRIGLACTQDESFSTVDAASKLHDAGLNARKQKGVIDQAAAMEILNRYLEQQGEGLM